MEIIIISVNPVFAGYKGIDIFSNIGFEILQTFHVLHDYKIFNVFIVET